MKSSESYSLTKSCKSMALELGYTRKLKLNINLTGAIIRSHEDYLTDSVDDSAYPDNLLCELVAEVAVGSKIMLLIESLFIPTDTPMCDENYLYVFDYDSSRSKAMVAAGGEKGLCGRTYPRTPIITTGPYITIVFNSKIKSQKIPHDAGFLITLTEIVPVDKNSACGLDQYRCGTINSTNMYYRRHKRSLSDSSHWSLQTGVTQRVTVARRVIPTVSKSSVVYYCIPLSLVCDGVRNCHDASDEDSMTKTFCLDLQKAGIINKFLSLGLSASITIAVGCIIAITLCVGLTACYCMRLCTSGLHHRRQTLLTKEMNTGLGYQGMVVVPPLRRIVNPKDYYTSNFIAQPSSGFMSIRDNSSTSSYDTDKVHCPYNDPHKCGYINLGRPASDKICHWGTSSVVSYPSNSDGHHSHPETPYMTREPSKHNRSPRSTDRIYRSSLANLRCHHNSYSHQTPTSSRSAKSTKSTKSSNIDKKNCPINESNPRDNCRQYPVTVADPKARIMGPVLGEV